MLTLVNYSKHSILSISDSCFNASFIPDLCYICYRKSNYTFINHNNKDITYCAEPYYWSEQILYNTRTQEKRILTTYDRCAGCKLRGLEDARFIKWNDKYYVTVTKPNIVNGQLIGTMTLLTLDKQLNIIEHCSLNTNSKIEKNWQPIEVLPYVYVYSYKPFTLLNINTSKVTYVSNNDQQIAFRGSTPICSYGEYNICLVHTHTNRKYVHYVVLFDNGMNILKISNEFCFFGARIEFCTGMKVNDDLSVELLVSVNDIITYSVVITHDILHCLLNDKLSDVHIDTSNYDRFLQDALTIDNKLATACLSTYSKNKEILTNVLCSDNSIISNDVYLKKILYYRVKSL